MAFVTPQGVMKTVAIKYINLCWGGCPERGVSTLRPWPPGPACGAPHPPPPGHRSQEALGAVACRCCRSFRLAWETWLLPSLPLSLRGPGPSSPAALGMHVYLEGRREEGLLTSSDLLCVGFLRSVWSAHPEEPSRRQRDQDPLPHCQEDASVPSQRPPGSPVPALLAGTAALPIQVGGSRLGCHGPELATQKCWAHSLLAEEWARFSVQRSLSRHTAGPCGLRARTREPPPPLLSGSCQLVGDDRGDSHHPDRRGHAELHLGVLHGETYGQSLGPEQCRGSGELQCRAGGEAVGPSVLPPCAAALL